MVKASNSGATFTMPSGREVLSTRVVDAPRRLVFDAWTMPEHGKHWYGLRGLALAV